MEFILNILIQDSLWVALAIIIEESGYNVTFASAYITDFRQRIKR
jgi:hypothetical protein